MVGTELWGFMSPVDVDIEAVKAAASKVQPHYAVSSKYLAMETFPHTSKGKVVK